LTECSDLSEAEAEGMETAAVAVKTAVAIETLVVTITMAALTVKMAVVHQRGRWFISNVSDVRIMWNITAIVSDQK
jgi:hypothetical protein